jgi:hypothetical protein
MLWLASTAVAARIDPSHGGEVLDLIDLRSGRQLLGRPPFASDEPVAGELDETTWTRSYRGGWQLLVPNAGNPCIVDGTAHGFHGRASTESWELLEQHADEAVLGWEGHGLNVRRRLMLRHDRLTAHSTVRAERTTAFVWVEHIGLGVELLDPAVEIELGGGSAYEVSEATGPAQPPDDAGRWPEVRLLDGTLERADRAILTAQRSRLLIVAQVAEGALIVRNRDRRQGLQIEWDRRWLPHLWMWHEVRTTGGPWRGLTETLVVEPASVPHTLGLRTARELGQAHLLEAGEQAEVEVMLRPLLEDAA